MYSKFTDVFEAPPVSIVRTSLLLVSCFLLFDPEDEGI
jgi:hypothetical protein